MKIVTLTLNPALDKSTEVERLVPESKLRCTALRIDAGGGGINVSKGIQRLGGVSTAVFPAGGVTGRQMRDLLTESGIATDVVETAENTRESFAVRETSTNHQFRFTPPGAALPAEQAAACLDRVAALRPDLLVASGSLPPGLPETYYEEVAVLAKRLGARLLLDTSGKPLQAAADEGLYLLKPNLAELSALAGVAKLELNEVDDAAMEIIRQGKCEVVVVSLGPRGALVATREGFEHIPAPTVEKRTTVGAGDSMVAGMAWALSTGKTAREMAQWGVACGTAATMGEGTELFRRADAERLFQWIERFGERYRLRDF